MRDVCMPSLPSWYPISSHFHWSLWIVLFDLLHFVPIQVEGLNYFLIDHASSLWVCDLDLYIQVKLSRYFIWVSQRLLIQSVTDGMLGFLVPTTLHPERACFKGFITQEKVLPTMDLDSHSSLQPVSNLNMDIFPKLPGSNKHLINRTAVH